ncbi:MAG TPA: hypothetical protein VJN66_05300 [Rhodanobacteraceae bacterium]|nr:hypothetical protein [Rhodanobacteraceae bacterium]
MNSISMLLSGIPLAATAPAFAQSTVQYANMTADKKMPGMGMHWNMLCKHTSRMTTQTSGDRRVMPGTQNRGDCGSLVRVGTARHRKSKTRNNRRVRA